MQEIVLRGDEGGPGAGGDAQPADHRRIAPPTAPGGRLRENGVVQHGARQWWLDVGDVRVRAPQAERQADAIRWPRGLANEDPLGIGRAVSRLLN